MEQEVNMKTTCIAIQSSEKAGQAFMRGLNGFVEKQKSVIRSAGSTNKSAPNKEVAGKIVKVKDLRKDGSQVEYVDMGNDELKNFRKYARKYGVTYSMEKTKQQLLVKAGYRLIVLNTINFKRSMHYNRATCSPLKRRRTALY